MALILTLAAALSTALLWLLLMLTVWARTADHPLRGGLTVLGVLPGAVLGYMALYGSAVLASTRQAPWRLLAGSTLWLVLFSIGAGLLIYHRRSAVGSMASPVSSAGKWLLASGAVLFSAALVSDHYSQVYVETLRQAETSVIPAWQPVRPDPKWHFYNRAHAVMHADLEWYLETFVGSHKGLWARRILSPGFRPEERDRDLLRGKEGLVELLLKATAASHEGVPAELPLATMRHQDIRVFSRLIDVDTRLRAADGRPGVARGNMAMWQMAVDAVSVDIDAGHEWSVHNALRDASVIQSYAAKNTEAILADLPDDSPELAALAVPRVRAQMYGPSAIRRHSAIAFHVFTSGNWPRYPGHPPMKHGARGFLRWPAYRLFLRHHDAISFASLANGYALYVSDGPAWFGVPQTRAAWSETLPDRLTAGPITRKLNKVLSDAVFSVVRSECLVRMAEVLLACRGFHINQGRYPESLDELVPEYMETAPGERIVKYRAEEDGCIVYSDLIVEPQFEDYDVFSFRLGRRIERVGGPAAGAQDSGEAIEP